MIEIIIKFLEKIDSYKKVVILIILAISSLGLIVAYDLHKTYLKHLETQSLISLHSSFPPCEVVKLQEDVYLLTVDLPIPQNTVVDPHVFKFSVIFWVNDKVSGLKNGPQLCKSLLQIGVHKDIQSTLNHFIQQRP